ncbi:MAG: DUF2723 domain-containing protein [Candidatus Abyssobacteria bacterium SURF_5]|uniref:DUF2723 domain-containing protein n=1 Tax=Abyssobacteria bacterium (strain SURF_5) TaxID=2093360 RepID=A0A3A4NW21_ABYX5|nr:MAG: DUF2723 domain-containing protein [Candidatus Abyssubacteria bacterium SURF_5]
MQRYLKREHLAPVIVFLIVFGVYIYTLCPTVFWDDAGELIAACYTLGIPHPPGHPLYALLGRLFTLLPIGSPAYRVNLMSAFFGALTCVVLFQIVRELGRKEKLSAGQTDFSAAISALGAAFSLLMWEQSVVAETTTLHTFFMMLVTLMAFRIDAGESNDPQLTRRLLVLSFVYGLSFTNHVAGLFFAPSLALVLFARLRWVLVRPARLLAMCALFLLALCLYAYLPIRSAADPAIDWGNPENLRNFLWVVTAKQYSAKLVQIPTLVGLIYGLRNLTSVVTSNLTIIGVFLALAGTLFLWKKRRAAFLYTLLIIAVLFFTTLNSAFISAYLVPAILLAMVWVGFGIGMLSQYLSAKRSAILYSASAFLILLSAVTHYREANKRNYSYAADYGRKLLSSLPKDAVLITGSANPLFISWYLQICEGFRTDVKIITRNGMTRPGYLDQVRSQYPELEVPLEFQYEEGPAEISAKTSGAGEMPWFAAAFLKEFHQANVSRFPFFWEGSESNHFLIERFVPYKFVFQILPPGPTVEGNQFIFLDYNNVKQITKGDAAAGEVYGNHFFNYAVFYQWHNDILNSLRYYQEALLLNPRDTRALNNVGALLYEQNNAQEGFTSFHSAFRIDPNDPVSNHNVGQALLLRNEVSRAIPFFRRAIKFAPSNFEDHYSLGLCYASLANNKRASKSFQKALLLKPDSAEALSSLGVLYLRLHDLQQSEKYLSQAVESDPNNCENWYNLACLHMMNGKSSAAASALEKALALGPAKTASLVEKDKKMLPLFNSLQHKNNP